MAVSRAGLPHNADLGPVEHVIFDRAGVLWSWEISESNDIDCPTNQAYPNPVASMFDSSLATLPVEHCVEDV